MGTTYNYIQNAGSSVDWNGELDLTDNQGHIVQQRFNWTLPGGALTGLYPADPLSTIADDVQIGSAGGSSSYQVTISQSDHYGKSARAQNLSIAAGSSLTLLGGDQGAYSNFVITSLTVNGNIHNAGQITINTDAYHGSGILLQTATTLDGGGKVSLNDINFYSNSGFFNNSDANVTLTNVNNEINGRGEIETASAAPFGSGTGVLTFINHGIVNANAGDVSGGPGNLTISTGSASIATINDGVFEATGPGTLVLKSLRLDNRGGQIYAADKAKVSVYGSRIIGGSLNTTGTGKIILQDGASILDGSLPSGVITNAGTLVLTDGHGAVLKSGLHNTGSIEIHADGAYSGTDSLTIDGDTSIDGGGAIHLSTSNFYSDSQINSTAGQNVTLTNVDNSIDGGGSINTGSNGSLNIVNQVAGKINANTVGVELVLHPTSITNAGLMEATTGVMRLQGVNLDQTSTGVLAAYGAGSQLYVSNYTTIRGGSIDGSGGGVVVVSGANRSPGAGGTIDGRAVPDGGLGAVTIKSGGILSENSLYGLTMLGSVVNGGKVQLNGSVLSVGAGGLTLSGGGQIVLQLPAPDSAGISGLSTDISTAATLHNVDNIISGRGVIGHYQDTYVKFDNQAGGVINANDASGEMRIDTTTVLNAGLIESTTGQLSIANSTIDNRSGGRLFAGDGGFVQLSSATVLGGSLQGAGTGYYSLVRGSNSLSVIAATNIDSTVKVGLNNNLQITGDISCTGTLVVDTGDNYDARLKVAGNWTGSATISLGKTDNNRFRNYLDISGVFSAANSTISGAGNIVGSGGATTSFTNSGIVDALYADAALNIATGATVTNNGVLKAEAGATLKVSDAVVGSGSAVLTGGGTVDFSNSFQQSTVFQGLNAGKLSVSQAYTGLINGLNKGDLIDLKFLKYNASFTINWTPGSLAILSGSAVVATLKIAGNFTASNFALQNDGAGATLVSVLTAPAQDQPVHANATNGIVHANNIALSGSVKGALNFIDGLQYIASYRDLINVFGANEQAGLAHYNSSGLAESRLTTFDGLDYIASNADLVNAFKNGGSLQAIEDAGAAHYIQNGVNEGRTTTFNALDYTASYADLRSVFGTNGDAAALHYIQGGSSEGRTTSFNGLDYIASYADLRSAFGTNEQAGAAHYIQSGAAEGRTTTFNGLDYIASYGDLSAAFGSDGDAGAKHYISSGSSEGRATTFDGLEYIASYADLRNAFGVNEQAGASHYIQSGGKEGRTTTFDALAYTATYTDLMSAFGTNRDAAATHYIQSGASEGRTSTFDVSGYIAGHSDLAGKFANNDDFLTAYITTYTTTGHLMT